MDGVYRHQRRIYDASRRYFLLGREQAIAGIRPGARERVLEIACGTGRNLDLIGRRHPEVRLFGVDISAEMLRSARAKLGGQARLAHADACDFDAEALLGEPHFEHILVSFAVSMIPDWQRALQQAVALLPPGGSLHVVDFSDGAALPGVFSRLLRAWLNGFHVRPRHDLSLALQALADAHEATLEQRQLFRRYSQHYRLRLPAPPSIQGVANRKPST